MGSRIVRITNPDHLTQAFHVHFEDNLISDLAFTMRLAVRPDEPPHDSELLPNSQDNSFLAFFPTQLKSREAMFNLNEEASPCGLEHNSNDCKIGGG